ncbi:hypothetical protein Bca4012_090321 [Brassica carinata]|uniref:Uncharacterized protein n=1 Tax=Brassica carinata TaxID=52824 RepID=A0A8X7TM56_BRACI|nr:hypothetical protein Bca52824_086332 [Brassica carinata]
MKSRRKFLTMSFCRRRSTRSPALLSLDVVNCSTLTFICSRLRNGFRFLSQRYHGRASPVKHILTALSFSSSVKSSNSKYCSTRSTQFSVSSPVNKGISILRASVSSR